MLPLPGTGRECFPNPLTHSCPKMQPACPPAPPPPAPPPPPPPPPPPLAPSPHGPLLIGKGHRRRSKMRNFNWETLPKHSVIGKHNIWTADITDGEYELDTDHMEELFSHSQGRKHPRASIHQGARGLPTSGPGGELVSILSSKRSMNIGIFLKQFKRPVKDMIADIKSGRGLGFGSGKLRELCKLLPEEGELKQLVNFKGDPSALPEADLFMLLLVKIPSYEERLNCLVLKEELFPLMAEIKEFLSTLTAAGRELLECDNLHSVIRLVLKTGNYMNAGGYAGSAIGFRMTSLLKLADTRANKPGMNLMHYVVMQALRADEALLRFPEQLKHIEAAARINKGDIEAEIKRQVKQVQEAKDDTLKEEDLKAQMEDFLKDADVCLEEIETDLEELQSASDSVADYFCEDPKMFRLEECCSIFHSFCERFMRAMQENKAREMTELKRRHAERLQIAAKRRSTATCSSRDKEMDGVALESVLQNFLTKRVSRRRLGRPSSSHGTPPSHSPTNGSLSEIISQTNLPSGNKKHGHTFRAKELGRKEWNSAAELTGNSLEQKLKSHSADGKVKSRIAHEGEMKPSRTEDSRDLKPPAKRTPNIMSPARSFSATTDDDEEDLQDNTKEEAQKLREASRKVLRYQNSRGSTSSVDYALENQNSPALNPTLTRQFTFDEETQRYPGDPTNEDLVRFLLSSQSFSKSNLNRRHTLPPKIPKTKEEEDKLRTRGISRSPDHVTKEQGTQPGEGAGQTPPKPVFDSTDISQNLKKPSDQEQGPPSAEKKSKPNDSAARRAEGEQSQEHKSMECTGSHLQMNNENIPPRSMGFKTEDSGVFFNFFKRLGSLSKLHNSKQHVPVQTCTESGV